MAITQPINFLPIFPGWTPGFELRWRQEQSVQASGRVIVKDMGSPLWTMKGISKTLRPNALDQWRARLTSLENGLATFLAYPLSRTYPILYPNGSWPTGGAFSGTTGNLASINANRKAITVSALPAGFTLSIGDFISLGGNVDLHQVMEAATAAAGTTTEFEIRPGLWTGRTTGAAVSVFRPACQMAIVPGSISTDSQMDGRGIVSFQAMESRL
jgi:hypothetical protein